MTDETMERLNRYVEKLNEAEKNWRKYGARSREKMDMTWLAFGIECVNRIDEARYYLFEIFPELRENEDGG